MKNNFYITSRLAKIEILPDEMHQITLFFKAMQNNLSSQKHFFQYCKKYKLAPWIYTQILRNGLDKYLDYSILEMFAQIHKKSKQQNESRNLAAQKFLREFQKYQIEVAILKGNLFLHTVYNDLGYKRMNDFDILIHQSDWEKAQEVYLQLNYIPLGFGWSGERQKPAKFSHVGMSFINRDFNCIIGTQWGLKSPTSPYRNTIEAAWADSRPFDFNGFICRQLSPEYNLLHLILHLGIYKCGTRDLMDIYNLYVSEKDNIDEQKLIQIFTDANALEKAWFALKLAQVTSGGAIPESLLQKLKSRRGYLANRLQDRLKMVEKSGDLHNSYNDYFQDIEKQVIYMNLFPEFHRKMKYYIRIKRLILWPKMEMALRLTDKNYKPDLNDKIFARLKAPFLVLKLIGQEIGQVVTHLLLLKLAMDVIWSVKNYFIKQKSYFDYLKMIGVDPQKIEKVVRDIE